MTRPSTRSATALLAVALAACSSGGGGQGTGSKDQGDRKYALEIVTPKDGAAVKGNVAELKMRVKGMKIVSANGNTSGQSGHFHVFIDREPVAVGEVIPKEPDIIHGTANPIKVNGLSIGEHKLTVVLGDGKHQRVGAVQAARTVRVEGPSISVKGPTSVKKGEDFEIEVESNGVDVTPTAENVAGASGHLHVFIDRDVTPPNSAIPQEKDIIHTGEKTIEIPGFEKAGEKTLLVVLGDAAHVPWKPAVSARFVVQVT